MKKLLCPMLACTLTLSSVLPCWSQVPGDVPSRGTADSSPAECTKLGRLEAQGAGTGGAFTVGLASGLGLGLIGTGLAWGLQGKPLPPEVTLSKLETAECRLAYIEAYGKRGKSRKRVAALMGGLVGTTVLVAVVSKVASEWEGGLWGH